MSRINRWNERTSATRCGGLSLVLVTLGTIGSAEGGAPLSPPSEALPGIATYLPIQHIGGPALRDGWSVLDYSTLMGHEAYLIKLAKPVRNLTFYDHFEALLSGRPTQATTADAVDEAKLG